MADLPKQARFEIRRDILLLANRGKKLLGSDQIRLSTADRDTYEAAIKEMKDFTDYAPWQVLLMVSLSLACGTTIGWQRIVKTIGERIGKEHLTYAQGGSSELVAAAMIGFSTQSGLPTSTTHVLTSSIAGSMVASRGVKNINPGMVRSIALAWVLTLPVTMVLSGLLFLLFRSFTGVGSSADFSPRPRRQPRTESPRYMQKANPVRVGFFARMLSRSARCEWVNNPGFTELSTYPQPKTVFLWITFALSG